MTKSFSSTLHVWFLLGLLNCTNTALGQAWGTLELSPGKVANIRYEAQTNSFWIIEKSQAIPSPSLPAQEYVSLHQHIPAGTRLRLYNPLLQKAIYVKNEGIFSSDGQGESSIMLSQKAIESICSNEQSTCELEVSYPTAFSKEINFLRQELQKVKTQNASLEDKIKQNNGIPPRFRAITRYSFIWLLVVLALWYAREM